MSLSNGILSTIPSRESLRLFRRGSPSQEEEGSSSDTSTNLDLLSSRPKGYVDAAMDG